MSKRKKAIIITVGIISIFALLVPVIAPMIPNFQQREEVGVEQAEKETKKLSEDEQEELVEDLENMIYEGYRPTEIEKELDEILPKLDKKHSTKAVRNFMYSIEEISVYFGELLNDFLGGEVFYSLAVDEIDDPIKDIDKLSNRLAKGYLEEMLRQYLLVQFNNKYFYIEPDAKYVLEKYGKYTEGDYKDYLNLLAKQIDEPIFDHDKETYIIERLAENLLYIENARDRWENGDFAQDWLGLERQLYEAFFAYSHALFFDEEIENEGTDEEYYTYTLKPEIREKYEEIMLSNKDTQLAKDIEELLEILDETNNVINEKVDEHLNKKIKKKFDDGGSESEGVEKVDEETPGEETEEQTKDDK